MEPSWLRKKTSINRTGVRMKKLELTGELEVWAQEGGYCSPKVNVGAEDLTGEISRHVEYLMADVTTEQGRVKGIYRVTVERIDLDD